LLAFPFSPQLWFAVGLLWILDAANNTAMEPYRAFVGDKLPNSQLTFGYQMQSLFVGAGITIANFSLFLFQDWFSVPPVESASLCSTATETVTAIPKWVYYSFFLGAIASVTTILWSVWKTPEIPPSDKELTELKVFNKDKPNALIQILSVLVVLLSVPLLLGFLLGYIFPVLFENYNLLVILILGFELIWLYLLYKLIKRNPANPRIKKIGDLLSPFIETTEAIGNMPKFMWRLSAVYFFQWYALFCYWQFITPMLRSSLYGISNQDNEKFEGIMEACKAGDQIGTTDVSFAQNFQLLSEQALAQTGLMNGTYNLVTMLVALALVPFARKYGSKLVYVASLAFSGIAMLSMPFINDQYMLLLPMILFGIGWAAMMGIPYSMVSKVIPEDKRGVYMGIVNMMIVIPMLIQTVSFGPILKNLLGNNPENAILFGGVFFVIGAILALRLTMPRSKQLEV
jgi:maltose/moltooligosaccharide transporter